MRGEVHLAAVEIDLAAGGDLRTADVDCEGAGLELARREMDVFDHQAARFRLHRFIRLGLRVAEGDRHAIIALGHGDREHERSGRGHRARVQRVASRLADGGDLCPRLEAVAGRRGVSGGGCDERVAGCGRVGAELKSVGSLVRGGDREGGERQAGGKGGEGGEGGDFHGGR